MIESANILIVEDDAQNMNMLNKMISSLQHNPILAENGLSALSQLEKQPVDLVLLDILMPEMEGTELLELLRETNMDVNVIVISANIQDTVRDRCMNLGVSEFFGKPPDKEKLKMAIEDILNKKEQG